MSKKILLNSPNKKILKKIIFLIGPIGGIFGVISKVFSVGWTVFTYNKFLPLQRANVIFLENSDINHSNKNNLIQSGDMVVSFDQIEPKIKNIGKATAEDIEFKIYTIYFDESLKFPNSSSSIEKSFDERLIHDLLPDTEASFGSINIPQAAESCNRNLKEERQQVALIFHLKFIDSLTKKKNDRIFLYQYGVGTDNFFSLIEADYNKIKNRLIQQLEVDNSDNFLLSYLKNKK